VSARDGSICTVVALTATERHGSTALSAQGHHRDPAAMPISLSGTRRREVTITQRHAASQCRLHAIEGPTGERLAGLDLSRGEVFCRTALVQRRRGNSPRDKVKTGQLSPVALSYGV